MLFSLNKKFRKQESDKFQNKILFKFKGESKVWEFGVILREGRARV
jgi:hypothetical protein